MSDSSAREEHERLARYQWLLPGPNWEEVSVPGDHLQEPEISLQNYLYDTNGDYGTSLYHEGVEHPMTSSGTSGGDGNLASLQAYKLHAPHYPTHAGSRDERILAETLPERTDYRLPPLLQRPASRALPVPAGPSFLLHPSRATPPHLGRQPDIPRKRNSDVALTELSDYSDSDAPPQKKPRLDPPQKHPLLSVNPNLPPYITTQYTTIPYPPVPAGSPSSVISQSAPMHVPSLPQGPVQSVNEILSERTRVAGILYELRSSLSTRPDIDRNLANINAWQQRLSAIDLQIAKMQMTAGPEGPGAPLNPHPSLLVPTSTMSVSSTPEPGPSEARHDVYLAYTESEGETSNVENDQSNGFASLPMSNPAISTTGSSRPANLQKFLQDCNRDFFDANATVQKGLERLGLRDLEDTLPGMELPLMPHQVLGVAFMLDRERSTFKGGILADEMGLGKTVQTIAAMTQNQGTNQAKKTNLIVAPLALLEQWKREIQTFVEPDVFKILIYHGPSRTKSTSIIQQADVVLTTYQTLALEWPDELKEARKAKKKAAMKALGRESSDAMSEDERGSRPKYGPLMEVTFWRVILDEAQSIRNPSTRVSTAVTHLLAEHRWCLTGTPIVNTLKDAFGLLRFLRHQPFGEWNDFHNHISKYESRKPTVASHRVQAIFATILLRRNKETTLDGKKLIELPPKTINFENLDFGEDEREIYSFVQQKSAAVFNRYLRAGTVLKNYMHVLVLLLRLRQITVHPCLIMENAEVFEVIDGRSPEHRAVLDRATREASKEFVELVKKRLLEHAEALIEKEKAEGEDATIEEEECPICTEPLGDDAVVTAPCAHFFCRECISAHITKVRNEDDGRFAEDERECPMCRTIISLGRLYMRKAFQPTDGELNPNDQGMDEDFNFRWEMRGSSRRDQDDGDDLRDFIVDDDDESEEENPQKKCKPKKCILSSDEEDDIVELSDSDPEEFSMLSFTKAGMEQAAAKARAKGKGKASAEKPIKQGWSKLSPPQRRDVRDVPDVLQPRPQPKMLEKFIPSAKMKWVMSQLKEWRRTHPSDKCIILSQWTSALELMSSYLEENFIEYVRYQGDMNQRERVEALDTFKTKKSIKVLLLSLKAGGVGLNLVAANRVISLDLAWNSATDFQAFDRTHRVGQKKEVSIHRLVINNTVEQRLIAIQEKKQGLADGSLGEGTGKKMARLSVRELASLFGLDV